MLGTTIHGRYRIDRLLGTGGMGAVYEAEHLGTGRRVALKVLLQGDIAEDPVMLARFQREARSAGAIQTQHITQVLDTGIEPEGNLPYLVMEYLDGEDVRRLLTRHGAIYPDLALRIAAQTCLGLQKAHEASIIHRDIKPANLFLARRDGGERVVKILDFGIAKRLDEGASVEDGELTSTGTMLGSPIYMSPEQAQASKDVDHRADIWSLGVVLYQALTGRTPFQHISGFGALIVAICRQPTPPLRDFAPWVSPELAAIVHRALQQDPAERFSGAAAMLDAIRPLLRTGHSITEEMLVPFDAAPTDRPPRGPGARVEGLALGAIISKFYAGGRGGTPSTSPEGEEASAQAPQSQPKPRPEAPSEPERLTVPLQSPEPEPPPKSQRVPPPSQRVAPKSSRLAPQSQPKSPPQSQPKPAPQSQPKPAPQSQPKPAPQSQPKPAPQSQPKLQPKLPLKSPLKRPSPPSPLKLPPPPPLDLLQLPQLQPLPLPPQPQTEPLLELQQLSPQPPPEPAQLKPSQSPPEPERLSPELSPSPFEPSPFEPSPSPSEPEPPQLESPQLEPSPSQPEAAQSQPEPHLLQPQPLAPPSQPRRRFRFSGLHVAGALVLAAGIGTGLYGLVSRPLAPAPSIASSPATASVEATPSAAPTASTTAAAAPPGLLDDARLSGVAGLAALAERYPNDGAVHRALMLAALDKGDHAKALQSARRAYALAPDAPTDDVHRVFIRVVNGPPVVAVVALDALGSSMGAFGTDTLYEVTIDPSMGKYPKDYAGKLLDKPEVRKNATPALALALELKSAGPCARKALFSRAGTEGDGRALAYLKPLMPTKGCTKRRAKVDCYECLGPRTDLKKAIDAIEARLNKR